MKKMKFMLLAVFAAIVLCGCGDNSLEYVEKDAEWVIYGNSKQLFKSKLWDAVEENDQFEEIKDEFKEQTSLELDDIEGNVSFWGTFDSSKNPIPKLRGAVVVLDSRVAEKVFDQIKKHCEDKAVSSSYKKEFVEKTTVGNCSGIVLKKQRKNQQTNEWEKATVVMTCVMTNNRTLQFFQEKEPNALWEDDDESQLADQIDQKVIAAFAVKGDMVRAGLKFGAGIEDVPKIGDIVLQLKASKKKLIIEGSVDISEIDED